jgi:hypothetical protein
VFFTAAINALPTSPASASWSSGTETIREDIAAAVEVVEKAVTGARADNFLGFEPDTLIINPSTEGDMFSSEDFAKVYQGNLADERSSTSGSSRTRSSASTC